MRLLTHKRYKTDQTGFSFGHLGHAPGVGLEGTVGVGDVNFFKIIQIWCVSYLHERHIHRRHFWGPRPLGPWGGAKRSNIIKSELQSQLPNCVYLPTNERYITFIRPPGSCPGVGL